MAVRHDRMDGPDQRLCQRCAGPVLAHLVLTGRTVTVRAVELPDKVSREGGPAGGRPEQATMSTVEEVEPRHVEGVGWTVELAEQVLRGALPSGSVFLRALVDEGGTATVARLRELTGEKRLHYMTLTLNTSARRVLGGRKDGSGERLRVAVPRTDPASPRSQAVYDYTLPEELVPILDAALRRVGS
ncbi:hypothetical protein [Actinosynnema sp. NPDC023587]|uniref:hypothetical protein n=1 Tax=Actinosynnema sp. NPDC023587 TaxID=3154695 RepID=UPI0033FAF05C